MAVVFFLSDVSREDAVLKRPNTSFSTVVSGQVCDGGAVSAYPSLHPTLFCSTLAVHL